MPVVSEICAGGYGTGRVLEGLEAEAREAKEGLWADLRRVPPWEWRKRSRSPCASVTHTVTQPRGGQSGQS